MYIVTWNARGAKQKWGHIYDELQRGFFDILLLQEMTEPPPDALNLRDHPDYSLYAYQVDMVTWYVVYFRWTYTRPGGNARCSIAILIKDYCPDDHEVIVEAGDKRPLLGIQPGPGQPLVCTLHATSSWGGKNDALDLLDAIETRAHAHGVPWVLAGDFNTPPHLLKRTLWGYPRWTVCPPLEPTHIHGGMLDYAIRSLDSSGWFACAPLDSLHLMGLSDHFPQQFMIEAAALFPRDLQGGEAMDVDDARQDQTAMET